MTGQGSHTVFKLWVDGGGVPRDAILKPIRIEPGDHTMTVFMHNFDRYTGSISRHHRRYRARATRSLGKCKVEFRVRLDHPYRYNFYVTQRRSGQCRVECSRSGRASQTDDVTPQRCDLRPI